MNRAAIIAKKQNGSAITPPRMCGFFPSRCSGNALALMPNAGAQSVNISARGNNPILSHQ